MTSHIVTPHPHIPTPGGNRMRPRRRARAAALVASLAVSSGGQVGVYASPNSTGHKHPVPLDSAPPAASNPDGAEPAKAVF